VDLLEYEASHTPVIDQLNFVTIAKPSDNFVQDELVVSGRQSDIDPLRLAGQLSPST